MSEADIELKQKIEKESLENKFKDEGLRAVASFCENYRRILDKANDEDAYKNLDWTNLFINKAGAFIFITTTKETLINSGEIPEALAGKILIIGKEIFRSAQEIRERFKQAFGQAQDYVKLFKPQTDKNPKILTDEDRGLIIKLASTKDASQTERDNFFEKIEAIKVLLEEVPK